jgi:hypothetical protein
LVFIYAIVALLQGLALSGGFDVDVNVFFDFAVALSIGLGLVQESVFQALRREQGRRRHGLALAAWIAITLAPPLGSIETGLEEARRVFDAINDTGQEADIAYIKSSEGRAICQDLALCYWAGKEFEADTSTLKVLVLARPDLKREFIRAHRDLHVCAHSTQ